MSRNYDIVVYGSTSGAVATAIQAARFGHSVALISPHEHIGMSPSFLRVWHSYAEFRLGGIQVEGLGSTDIDNQSEFQNSTTLGGLNLELHRRISIHYNRTTRLEEVIKHKIKDAQIWKFESRVAEKVIADWLSEFPQIQIIKVYIARVWKMKIMSNRFVL